MRVPGGGVWGRVQGGGGRRLPVENKGKGEGGGEGGGWGGDRQRTGKSMHKLCRSYPLAIYPCNWRALDRVTKPKHRPNRQKLPKKV